MEMKRNISKAVRLIVLKDLKATGLLKGKSLQAIADLFGDAVSHRSTIMRDLRDLEEAEVLTEHIIEKLTGGSVPDTRKRGKNVLFKTA